MDAPLPLVSSELLTALVTASGERLDANDAWLDVFGDDALWGRLPIDDARFASDYVVEAARGGPVSHQVFLVDAAAGEQPVPVLLHFQPARLPDVEPGRFPVMLVGETLKEPASWAAEQTRRRRLEMLGRMTMGVAHDFNNLLTTVLGHAELLRSDLDACTAKPESYGHLETLSSAAEDGASLVRRIQQYIRNDKEERAEPVAMHALAAEVLVLTKPYWHNEPRRRGIAIAVEADLQPVPPLLGTPTELREVLVNLVLNAVQAMPTGGTLSVRTARLDGRGVSVEIADTGTGMTERVRRRIFEPLYTTKGTAGTGMGLTVSLGIVQEHNGRVEVVSAPGQGTRIRLLFPLAAEAPAPEMSAAPPAAPPESAPVAPSAATPGPVQSARPLRILVVDDEPLVRLVTTKLLRMRGHTVDDAEGGAEALDILDGLEYDLVVTDLSMPGMSGRELARAIRERTPTLPVVLLTGDTDAQAESADISAVVKKPFQLDVLEAAVQQAVGA